MTRAEFLEQLRSALQGNVQERVVQENVAYYNQYISEEVQKGKTEEEVLQMLGDPWILAKTIIAASDGTDEEIVYESGHKSYYSEPEQEDSYVRQNVHVFGIDTGWKKVVWILLVPLLIAMIIIRLIGKLRS